MTHKLISIDQAAEWLHVPVKSVEGLMSRGWLIADLPGEAGYFDATKVNRLKKRLERVHKQAKWKWSIAGAWIGIATAMWLIGRAGAGSPEDGEVVTLSDR